MFIPISIIVSLTLHTINNIAIPKAYEIGLKKKGKLCKDEKEGLFKIIRSYIIDFIPYLNILSIIVNLFADGCLIALYDKIIDNYTDAYSAEYVKAKYERNESDKKDIIEAMTIDGASKSEIDTEMKKIASTVGKKEKGSSFRVDPDFSQKDYEWACAYEDARNFIDSLFTDVTLSKKDKYAIINELIKYVKTFENVQDTLPPVSEEKETNNIIFTRNEEVSNKVLEVINKHL